MLEPAVCGRRVRSVARILLPFLFGLTACVEEVVSGGDDLFPPLPDGAASFVGYSDAATHRVVCGNCHIGQQAEWEETAHANAWATLEGSGHATEVCEACHTVSQRGNVTSQPGGYETTRDARYHDVQCESCHGPGLDHVTNPDIDANQPMAPLAVGLDLTQGCGECHSGTHHPFVEEWAQSRHGQVQVSAAGRAECAGCHTGENALLAWGVRDEYLEKDAALNDPSVHLAITCGVCHDPHATATQGQLRFAVDVPSEEENLCMKCHHKRGVPDPTTFRGPHSPEGPLLLGYGGWWPPNMDFGTDTIVATHGSERNPRLCAGCHVNRFEVTDEVTGDFVFQATGHLFQAIPCLDAGGIPTTGDCGLTERTFQTCASAQCHDSEAVARNLFVLAETRVEDLATELTALLAMVPEAEFDPGDGRYTTAEGSQFNVELAAFRGSSIHNPVLMEALLRSSIRQVRQEYGLASVTGVSLDRRFGH